MFVSGGSLPSATQEELPTDLQSLDEGVTDGEVPIGGTLHLINVNENVPLEEGVLDGEVAHALEWEGFEGHKALNYQTHDSHITKSVGTLQN